MKKGLLIYGFPSTGKSTFARKNHCFDSDYTLGKLRSSSSDKDKRQTANAVETLIEGGFSGVTNLTTLLSIKPDIVFIRTNANIVRKLMQERGDDAMLVNSLSIESWINDVLSLTETSWKDSVVIDLADNEFILDHVATLQHVEQLVAVNMKGQK